MVKRKEIHLDTLVNFKMVQNKDDPSERNFIDTWMSNQEKSNNAEENNYQSFVKSYSRVQDG